MTAVVMAPPHRRRWRRWGRIARLSVLGVSAALGMSACGGPVARGSTKADPVPVENPLPTSLTATAGTWAAVPMGHLDQPTNTFWQLFFLPQGGGSWANRVTALGIATNGGLLLAAPGSHSLLVAIRPSNLLTYSAVVGTTDGASWVPAAPVPGTAESLAAGPQGQLLALIKGNSGQRVLAATSAASNWHLLVTARSLANSRAGHSCAPFVLTAVAFGRSGQTLVGASCGRRETVGLFADKSGTWHSVGPKVPVSAGRPHVQVLSLQTTGGRLTTLLAFVSRSGTRLMEGWAEAGGGWQVSGRLPLGTTGHLVSIGPAPGGGEFVLYSTGKDQERLATIGQPGTSWTRLPDPPKGTATVAFPASGRIDALGVADTVMTDWILDAGTSSWTKHQVAHVKILFGSSS